MSLPYPPPSLSLFRTCTRAQSFERAMTMTDAESHDESRCALRINIALFASLMPPCRADDHLGGFRKCIDDNDNGDDVDEEEEENENENEEENVVVRLN